MGNPILGHNILGHFGKILGHFSPILGHFGEISDIGGLHWGGTTQFL